MKLGGEPWLFPSSGGGVLNRVSRADAPGAKTHVEKRDWLGARCAERVSRQGTRIWRDFRALIVFLLSIAFKQERSAFG